MMRLHNDVLLLIDTYCPIQEGQNVLDCACGSGVLSESILNKYNKHHFNICMIDIEELQYPLDGAVFIKADLNESMVFKDAHFDLIVSLETIEHLNNPYGYIQKLNSALKPNGVIIISTPNIHNIISRLLFLFTGQLQWYRKWAIQASGHISPIYHPTFVSILEKQNLNIISYNTTTARILGTQIEVIKRGLFWGEISIYVLKKSR